MDNIPFRLSVGQLDCLIYGRLIYLALFHEGWWKTIKKGLHKSEDNTLSLLKASHIFTQCHHLIMRSIDDGKEDFIMESMIYHCSYDSRKRRNLQGFLDGIS
jgi:hypothetical protein